MDGILVLDFGGQYAQLIARRVREQNVYAEIRAYDRISAQEIKSAGYKGVIFTGGPNSVYDAASPHFDPAVLDLGVPILGICYGAQLMAYMAKGEVASAADRGEYGKTELNAGESPLFSGVSGASICWMSHTDYIKTVPPGFRVIAVTDKCPCAAMSDDARRLYAVQFHPEVSHTVYGTQMLSNFLFKICLCAADWKMDDFAARSIEEYKRRLSGKKVLLALSGGVDSCVTAVLLHKAIGDGLKCVFVDHGLLRKDEGELVERELKEKLGLEIIRVNAQERFLEKLKGIRAPEHKRRVIGEEFIRVFEQEAKKLGEIDVLAQGTIYPDVIESGKGDSAVIKSHHNVGALPDVIDFKEIVEPLRELFKDEVRRLGEELGMPRHMVRRQPFPGPGLAVRITGCVTRRKLELLRQADAIFREEMAAANMEDKADQYFAVLTDLRSVGVKGDARTYGYTAALRAVTTDDFMTAEWARLPYELLERASSRITNEIRGITRVVYDISSKPPATVEWE